jgi:hypothetical protein
MDAPLLTYLKTKSNLAYSGIAIASWYCLLASNANAQTPSTELAGALKENSDKIAPPTQISSTTNNSPPQQRPAPEVSEDGEDRGDNPAVDPQIAQVTTPITNIVLPTILSPLLFPNLLPQSTPIQPLKSILTKDLIPAPNNTPAIPSENAPTPLKPASTQDPRFLIPPKETNPNLVDPFSTQVILNGNKVSHFTRTVATAGYESGPFRNSDLSFDIYKMIGAKNVQSVTADRVVRVKSQLEVVGLRTVTQNQDIIVSVSKPQTLLGVREQISLDGNCLDGSGRTCTYLPGIKIDDSVIDPDKLQPRGVVITSQFGDVVSPSSVAAIRAPGFQGGANGSNYGIDLYIPAIGLVNLPPGTIATLNGERQEKISTGIAVNATQISQDLANNGKESTLSRTIRSLNYINGDRNQVVNAFVNAAGQILPEFQPSIAPGEPGARIVVNPNLYHVANAIRIPDNSQTVFQSGTGYAASHGSDPRVPPGAKHLALWVGLSPVVEREFERDYRYITLRDPRIVTSGGGEGGTLPVDVNLNGFGFNSGGLKNAYGQGYVSVYNRDVKRVDIEKIHQRTDYYPHVSLTGATFNGNTQWRYFTGAIVNAGFQPKTASHVKAYVGTDYSVVNPRGLSLTVGGVGYLNPDPEYYSQLSTSVNQSIALGSNPRNNLILGVNANYVIDGAIKIQSLPVRSAQSYISAGMAVNLGDVSLGGTQFFGNILPESVENKTIFNVGWKITDRLKVGGFVSAFDRNMTKNPFGASLGYDLDPSSNSTLYLGWNAAEIDFRRTLGPTANTYKDNTISVSLRYGF